MVMRLPLRYLFQDLLCGKACHQDQRTEGNMLQEQGQAFIFAVPCQLFGLGTEDVKEVCGRRRHTMRMSVLP